MRRIPHGQPPQCSNIDALTPFIDPSTLALTIRHPCKGGCHMNGFVALVQGVYFLMTGLWPLVSIDTFQRVTAPKLISGW